MDIQMLREKNNGCTNYSVQNNKANNYELMRMIKNKNEER